MDYNDRIIQLSKKFQQFFEDESRSQILVTICPYTFALDYTQWGVGDRPLNTWDFDRQAEDFALYNKKKHDIFMEYTAGLDNDYVPALGVNMGYGVHSAYYSNQEVIMGEDTSWTHPCIHDWNDMDKLNMDDGNYWFRKVKEIAGYYARMQDGDYAVSAFANAGPGDMANALRGNELFYDIYDSPDQVHRLMGKCADAVIWMEKELRKITGFVNGGVVTANCWFPGEAPYLSLDFNDLCAVDVFNQFDFQYCRKILDYFGGGFVHHHAKGVHIHEAVTKLPHLKLLEISLDPNCERPIDRLPELYEMHGSLPLMVRCHARDVYAHIEELKMGRTVLMLNIDSLSEGQEVMKLIRKHSII